MVLHDVSIYGSAERKHIHLLNGFIQAITGQREALDTVDDDTRLEMDGAIVLPGFINSHDHLDFNCFPQLGNKIYTNYTEWGTDIHGANADVIKAVQQIPQALRVQWGLYKNLINGFTTVVNHGERLDTDDALVNVFRDHYQLHSPAFEKNWSLKLNHPLRNKKPFVMHIGEGTDEAAHKEIGKVIKANLFKRKIVAVHGVAMDFRQAASFEGVVWCPASNYFLLGKTAAVNQWKRQTKIVFGMDSTLTSSWQVAAHFTAALDSGMVTEKELLDMLTVIPASLWGFGDRGVIKEKMKADLVVKQKSNNLFNNYQEEMLLVVKGGETGLAAAAVFAQLPAREKINYEHISIGGNSFMVKAGIVTLVNELLSYYPQVQIPFELA